MNKKAQTLVILAIAMSFILSGCNRALTDEPTMTPVPTSTQAPKLTITSFPSATLSQARMPSITTTATKLPTAIATMTLIARTYFDLEKMSATGERCRNSPAAKLAIVQFHPGTGFDAVFPILSPCYGVDELSATASEFGWQTGTWNGNPDPTTAILLYIKPDSPGGKGYEFEFATDQIDRYQGAHVFPPLEMTLIQKETATQVSTLETATTNEKKPTSTAIHGLVPDFDVPLSFPLPGADLREWGAPGVTIVWAGTATYPTDCTDSTDAPMDYYCRKEPSRSNQFWGNWGNDSLHAAGVVQKDGATTIMFDQPVRDIVIVWGKHSYVDSIEAILEDGTLIPMGYAPDSKGAMEYKGNRFNPIVPFVESAGRWNHTIETHGWNSHGFDMHTYDPQPCGFMGLGPDNNLILVPYRESDEPSEGLLGLFPLYSYRNLEYGVYERGLNAYKIIGIIVTQYDEPPTGSTICE